jgi:hypothetical protein
MNRELIKQNIEKFAQDLTMHPEAIEFFLWEAYYSETLGFDSDGNAYHRATGDQFIPTTLNL